MHITLMLGFLLAGWRWGDWRNWTRYYPTILFFITGDLLYNFILYNYPMWVFHTSFDKALLPNHTLISLAIDFICFPVKVLIYLGRYPENKSKLTQGLYILAWTAFFTVFEFAAKMAGGITHHHGWNMLTSFLFYIVVFVMLRVHYHRPLFAWIISFGVITFLMISLKVPISVMK